MMKVGWELFTIDVFFNLFVEILFCAPCNTNDDKNLKVDSRTL